LPPTLCKRNFEIAGCQPLAAATLRVQLSPRLPPLPRLARRAQQLVKHPSVAFVNLSENQHVPQGIWVVEPLLSAAAPAAGFLLVHSRDVWHSVRRRWVVRHDVGIDNAQRAIFHLAIPCAATRLAPFRVRFCQKPMAGVK